jgi:hypothetical protein
MHRATEVDHVTVGIAARAGLGIFDIIRATDDPHTVTGVHLRYGVEELNAGDLADARSIALIVRRPTIRVMVPRVVAVRRTNDRAALGVKARNQMQRISIGIMATA